MTPARGRDDRGAVRCLTLEHNPGENHPLSWANPLLQLECSRRTGADREVVRVCPIIGILGGLSILRRLNPCSGVARFVPVRSNASDLVSFRRRSAAACGCPRQWIRPPRLGCCLVPICHLDGGVPPAPRTGRGCRRTDLSGQLGEISRKVLKTSRRIDSPDVNRPCNNRAAKVEPMKNRAVGSSGRQTIQPHGYGLAAGVPTSTGPIPCFPKPVRRVCRTTLTQPHSRILTVDSGKGARVFCLSCSQGLLPSPHPTPIPRILTVDSGTEARVFPLSCSQGLPPSPHSTPFPNSDRGFGHGGSRFLPLLFAGSAAQPAPDPIS